MSSESNVGGPPIVTVPRRVAVTIVAACALLAVVVVLSIAVWAPRTGEAPAPATTTSTYPPGYWCGTPRGGSC